VLDRLRQTNDPTQATRIVSDVFLRPGIPGMGSREKWTQRALGFSQQPQMASNMPVVQPGPGATQMPMAGLADMPAQGASPSAMETMPQGGPPMAPGGGVPIANTEEDVQFLEARMAAEQGTQDPAQAQTVAIVPNAQNADNVFSNAPMGLGFNPFVERAPFDPAQEGAPNAQNAGDVFSPDPMGMGYNPFVQRPPFEQSPDMPQQAAQEVALNPAQDTVALPASNVQPEAPPQRPVNPGPQSPFVPPAMRQPMPVDMGGENGATPMAFIQDQFARQDQARGGAPMQGFNPFVPQAAQGPQMAGGGGSAPVATQAAPMAGEASQAPTSRMQQLAAVVSNRFTPPEVRQLAIQQYQQEQAQALAVQERARAEAQQAATARALGIDPALGGNQAVVAARAQQMFNNRQEGLAATNQAREAEGRRMGLQGPALQQYTLTGQLPNANAGTDQISAQSKAREEQAKRMGMSETDPRFQTFVLTGKMPREDAQPLTATDKKAILEADEGVLAGETALKALNDAKALSPRANQGWGASARATLGNNLPDWMVPDIVSSPQSSKDTAVYENVVLGQALSQLKSIFGAAPTEGERQILMDLQASVSKPDKVRQELLATATGLAEKRLAFNRQRAAELRGGDFYKPESKRSGQPSAQTGAAADAGAALQAARDAIAKGAPRQTVIDRLRQGGIDPGGL
jgi:hypothetical protein